MKVLKNADGPTRIMFHAMDENEKMIHYTAYRFNGYHWRLCNDTNGGRYVPGCEDLDRVTLLARICSITDMTVDQLYINWAGRK